MVETNPQLNLATFVTTYMDDHATRLMNEAIAINYIDQTEYPRVAVMASRCINIIANLWHSPEKSESMTGAVGIGSSSLHAWWCRRMAPLASSPREGG